ncbi:hypothetical protein GCM10010500_66440 [Streptomyces nigrescens]|nr:hypothetical protein GCM10010500_66440 [Streptomyces libani subsp. libani]
MSTGSPSSLSQISSRGMLCNAAEHVSAMETISRGGWLCGREVSTPSGYVPRSCVFLSSVLFGTHPDRCTRRSRIASLAPGGPAARRAVVHANESRQ